MAVESYIFGMMGQMSKKQKQTDQYGTARKLGPRSI